jgi:hypothetical protein
VVLLLMLKWQMLQQHQQRWRRLQRQVRMLSCRMLPGLGQQ